MLTAGFVIALAAITFGLTWQARAAQQRWTKLIETESAAVARLDDFIHNQNAFRSQLTRGDANTAPPYEAVTQLLEMEPLSRIDTAALRTRVRAYEEMLRTGAPAEELDAESTRIVMEANRLKSEHQFQIKQQLKGLRHESQNMMLTGFGVAWIVAMIGFAVARITNSKVVRPVEDLRDAAQRIAGGDLEAAAPLTGDRELYDLGVAFNQMARKLKESARTDELTGLPNYRAFREHLDGIIERANRYGEHFGVLVLDLDRFKKYNDSYGHQAGNEALRRVAGAIAGSIRVVDFAARYGGEEFAVLAPNVDVASLHAVAERIRSSVEEAPAARGGAPVTVSIGAAIYRLDGNSAEALFHVADERLYQAKREGRNRVIVTSAPAVQSAG